MLFRSVLSGQHGGVGRRLVTVSLDLHSTCNSQEENKTSGQKRGLRHRNIPVTREIVSLPDKSVTWTKVSLKEAKMWATPKTVSPSATWGPRETVVSSLGALTFLGGCTEHHPNVSYAIHRLTVKFEEKKEVMHLCRSHGRRS